MYTTLEQAWKMAIAEEGDPSNWDLLGFDSSEGAENLANILEPYLNVAKNCGTSSGCWYDDTIVSLTGSPSYGNINSSIFSKMVLNDGSMIAFATRSGNCSAVRGTSASLQNSCAIAFIDINGNQPPNTFGKDVFYFVLTKYNVVPMGSTFDTTYTFEKYCKTGTSSYGLGCTAWVIYNENMDYLKCSDLSWEEKSGCD